MNTSIQIDPVKDGKRLLMVCVAAFIMALNIRTLVHTGGLIPGGATGMTILIQRLAKLLLSRSISDFALSGRSSPCSPSS